MLQTQTMNFAAKLKRFVENSNNSFGIVIGRNTIDGNGFAFNAFMDDHQLASRFTLILVPALFHGQPYGFHRRFARGQMVTRDVKIKMTRPQAVWTVITVINTRKYVRAGNKGMTMSTPEISEGGRTGSHSSSFRCM
jgi:hypothetical protein